MVGYKHRVRPYFTGSHLSEVSPPQRWAFFVRKPFYDILSMRAVARARGVYGNLSPLTSEEAGSSPAGSSTQNRMNN